MLETPDYMQIGKRRTDCAACGASLVEATRHPSVLVERERDEATDASDDSSERPESPEAVDVPESVAPAVKEEKGEKEEPPPPFERRDYCPKCWDEMKEAAYFSFWVGRRTADDLPPRKLNRAERNVALAALFDSLSERDPDEGDFRPHLFFLAHLLMKYRIFKWRPAATDPETGETTLRFVRADSDEEVSVAEVEMPDDLIARIKQEVEAYLEQSTGQEIRL
ncbi:hypothetical protein JW916_09500 [Candidatus Sumerlaeota bacterium]|nr:hypothetical protein [Candidatus Sumerlaeota bacterium]